MVLCNSACYCFVLLPRSTVENPEGPYHDFLSREAEEQRYRLNSRKRSKQLNYRLSSFPYRRFIEHIDYKFYEQGLSVVEANAKKTSITCPICGYVDRKNRIDKETFRCRRCGFTFNTQYVACLNLFSRSNDGKVAIRGGRLVLISRKAGPVVPVNVAPNEPPNQMRWLREKPVQVSKILVIPKR